MSESSQYIHRSIGASFLGQVMICSAAFGVDWRLGFVAVGLSFHVYAWTCQKAACLLKIDELRGGAAR